MSKNKLLTTLACSSALLLLSGCQSFSSSWDSLGEATYSALPNFLKPYRADVYQGNLITSEMLSTLEIGMTQAQVQFALGQPLIQDEFHPNRWDYVYFLLKGNNEKQLRRLTIFFDQEYRVERWVNDEMPDEKTADQLILGSKNKDQD